MMRALFAVSGLLAVLISIGALVVHENRPVETSLSIDSSSRGKTDREQADANPEIRRVAAIGAETKGETEEADWHYDDTCPGDPRLLEIPGSEEVSGEDLIEEPEDRLAMAEPVFHPTRSLPPLTEEVEEIELRVAAAEPEAKQPEISNSEARPTEEPVEEPDFEGRPDPLEELFATSSFS